MFYDRLSSCHSRNMLCILSTQLTVNFFLCYYFFLIQLDKFTEDSLRDGLTNLSKAYIELYTQGITLMNKQLAALGGTPVTVPVPSAVGTTGATAATTTGVPAPGMLNVCFVLPFIFCCCVYLCFVVGTCACCECLYVFLWCTYVYVSATNSCLALYCSLAHVLY